MLIFDKYQYDNIYQFYCIQNINIELFMLNISITEKNMIIELFVLLNNLIS